MDLDPRRMRQRDRTAVASPTARFIILGAWGLLLVIVALLWAFGPFEAAALLERFRAADTGVAGRPWLPLALFAITVVALQIAVPQGLIVIATTLLLGLWLGVATALAGTVAGASVTYFLGRWLARRPVRRYAGVRFRRISRLIARRGIVNMAVVNLLPIGPYTMVNLAAGTSHIRFRDFLIGSTLGIVPTTVVIALLTHVVARLARAPTPGQAALAVTIAGLAAIGLGLLARLGWRWLNSDSAGE